MGGGDAILLFCGSVSLLTEIAHCTDGRNWISMVVMCTDFSCHSSAAKVLDFVLTREFKICYFNEGIWIAYKANTQVPG